MTSKAEQERRLAQQAAKTLPERETYSAKQAAMRLATDARTFRKFLRSSHCSFGAVGQGKRYEFTAEELIQIRDEFIVWREYSEARRTSPSPIRVEAKVAEAKTTPVPLHEVSPNEELQLPDFDDEEPTEEELMALENGEWED